MISQSSQFDPALSSVGLSAHYRGSSRKWSGQIGGRKVEVFYAASIAGGRMPGAHVSTPASASYIRTTVFANANIFTTFRSDVPPNPGAKNAVGVAHTPFANWSVTSLDPAHTGLLLVREAAVGALARILLPPVRSLALTSLNIQIMYAEPQRVHPDKLRQDILDLVQVAAEIESLPAPTADARQHAVAAESRDKKLLLSCGVIGALLLVLMVVGAALFFGILYARS